MNKRGEGGGGGGGGNEKGLIRKGGSNNNDRYLQIQHSVPLLTRTKMKILKLINMSKQTIPFRSYCRMI